MAALTDFYDYVLPNLPGAGQALVLQGIREAIITFCERSLVYTYDHPAIDVVGAIHTYTLTPEANTRIADILSARYNSTALIPANEDELDELIQDWRSTATGTPAYFYSTIERTAIRLVKTPAESLAAGLEVKLAQAPLAAATTVPDWLLERYRDAIMHGACARLHAMKKKPWTDGDLAVYHGHLFDQEIGKANTSKAKGHTRKRLRVRANFR